SKYQRVRESVLLRTMGATRRQVLAITALEYFFLGTIASFTGVLLALGGSWALAVFSFEIPFTPDVATMVLLMLGVALLTVLIGLANSSGVTQLPPLEFLQKEVYLPALESSIHCEDGILD